MVFHTKLEMPVEMFDGWVGEQAENYEYIAGEAVAVSSNHKASWLAAKWLILIGGFVLKHKLGRVTGEAGGYKIAGERYMPDIAYISYARQPELSSEGFLSTPPDLAVEVIYDLSNMTEQKRLRVKISNYLLEGVTVWVINPDAEEVEIHRNNHPVEIIGKDGVLKGYDVLPNFELAVRDLFEE